MTHPAVPETSVDRAAALTADGTVLLLDVREPQEWWGGHAPGAVHVPLAALSPADVPHDRPVAVICRSGNRSAYATAALAAAGVEAANVVGGMRAWAAAGHPVVRDDGSPGEVL